MGFFSGVKTFFVRLIWGGSQPPEKPNENANKQQSTSSNNSGYQGIPTDRPDPSFRDIWTAAMRRLRCTILLLSSRVLCTFRRIGSWIRENPKTTAFIILALVLFILACCMPAILAAAGFSTIGPVAGTAAASYQSIFGATAAFQVLQSAAMGGYGVSVLAATGAVIAGSSALIILYGDMTIRAFKNFFG